MRAPATILPLILDDVAFAARGATLLAGVSAALGPCAKTVVLGPNGAGKSLLLRLAHGLLRPSRGRVIWSGPMPLSPRKPHALVFQRPVLLRRSVRANVEHALALQGAGRRERRDRAVEALAHFGLGALAERPARVLSGGEQQRVALARAWAVRPEVLFLDEPTAALDPAATRAIEEMIHVFHGEGVKIVMTTHDLGQARRLADEVLFMHRGRLLEQTPAGEFFREPRSAEAAAFLAGDLLW